MNKLEKLLLETDYTNDEWKTFKKVERHNQLEDLKNVLIEYYSGNIEQLTEQDIECVLNRFDDYQGEYSDWRENMHCAINRELNAQKLKFILEE